MITSEMMKAENESFLAMYSQLDDTLFNDETVSLETVSDDELENALVVA